MDSEIIFEVTEDADGGFCAVALGHAIATQGDTMEELREMVQDAVKCHFGDGAVGTHAENHPAAFCSRRSPGCFKIVG